MYRSTREADLERPPGQAAVPAQGGPVQADLVTVVLERVVLAPAVLEQAVLVPAAAPSPASAIRSTPS